MAEAWRDQLSQLRRRHAEQRGLEPVTAEVDGDFDLDAFVKQLGDVVQKGRTLRIAVTAFLAAVTALAGQLGINWIAPPEPVEPQQIAAAVAAYEQCHATPLAWSAPPSLPPSALVSLPDAGGAAEVAIVGPAESAPGDLIVLEARGEYDSVKWILGNSTKTFLEVDGGKRVVFASGTPGEYRFFAVAAAIDGGRVSLDDASFVVRVSGPIPVPPPTPTPTPVPPTPVPPQPIPPSPPAPIPDTTSSISMVVIRDVDDLTADQAEVLLGLRTWSDSQPPAKVRHYEFAPDQQNENGQSDPTVAGYLAKKPATAKLPYVLLLATDATPAKVIWQGELPATAKELIDLATAKLKPSRPKVSAKE